MSWPCYTSTLKERTTLRKTAGVRRSLLPRPMQTPNQHPKAPRKIAVPVYSITRAEIDEFWRRKEMEEEEQRLAAEKEAARIKAKTLKIEDYILFEQMIREILEEGNKGDRSRRMERDITKNSRMVAAATNNTEAWIGTKHWWKRSAFAYLNEPALTSMDKNDRRKHAITHIPQGRCIGKNDRRKHVITHIPQGRCIEFRLSTPRQANDSTYVIF